MVDVALDGGRGADTLAEEADDLEVAVTLVDVAGDAVTNLELLGRLRSRAVDLHVAAPAGGRGLGASGADADRPQPSVDPGGDFVTPCAASHDLQATRVRACCASPAPSAVK